MAQPQVYQPAQQLPAQQVSYSSAGIPQIPVAAQPAFDHVKHQKNLKWWAKVLKYAGFFMIYCGVMTIVCNGLFCLVADSFTDMGWYNADGSYTNFTIDKTGLIFGTVLKIVYGYFMYRQGKGSVLVYKQLLKEYTDAETGVTQGIAMTERKSKKMIAHSQQVKKITWAYCFVTIVACLYFNDWLQQTAFRYIDETSGDAAPASQYNTMYLGEPI